MKTIPIFRPVLALLIACLPLRAEDEIEKAFRDALYAEEVKGDTEAALKAYQEVGAKFEQQRDMAATAVFRQAECLRKLGRKEEAIALYNRVLAQYGDKERVAKQSRENLTALGQPAAAPAGSPAAGGILAVNLESAEVARLEKLLQDSPDLINSTDESNPLTAAAEKGQVALVDYLLKKNPRVDTLVQGKAALHRAAEAGHLKVCQRLLDKGASVDLKTDKGATALALALDKGRFSVAELLLDRKANAGEAQISSHQAAEYANRGQEFQQVRPPYSQRYPALSLAFMRGAPVPLMLRLLEAGADPNDPGESGPVGSPDQRWPLAEAIDQRLPTVVTAILDKGFPLDKPVYNQEGMAIDGAVGRAKPSTPEATDDVIVEELRRRGASLKRDEVVRTAAWAELSGYVRAAVKEGASPHQLEAVIHNKKPAMVKLLLELGADPARKGEYGDAMEVAIRYSSLEAVESILAAKYPLQERLTKLTQTAGGMVLIKNGTPTEEGRKIFELFKEKAEKAGVLAEAMTLALNDAVMIDNSRMGTPDRTAPDTSALLKLGADAWKAENVRRLFENGPFNYGLLRDDFIPLWKAARILQNPDLRTAVWASRGPSLTQYAGIGGRHVFNQGATTQYRPFFRAIVSEKGIVPAGTLGRFLSAYGWSYTDDLTKLVISRLNKNGGIDEQVVDFIAIAKDGDVSKDIPLQWGDVIEIPASEGLSSGEDAEQKQRAADGQKVTTFLLTHYSQIDIGITIGDGQVIANADNERGPVVRTAAGYHPLLAAGLPVTSEPMPKLEVMRAATPGAWVEYTSNPLVHGDRVRIVPPEREPALSDEALRNAFTLAESDKGPYLRILQSYTAPVAKKKVSRGRELLADKDLFDNPQPDHASYPTLWQVLQLLHAPNVYGFGPVNWPAAKCRLAGRVGWEEMPLEGMNLDWLVVPGITLILPTLAPDMAIPPDTFDYAACAVDYELALGDQPPVKHRYQPPVPQLKRAGDKWVWSWQRREGDSWYAVPDLSAVLLEHPDVRKWPWFSGIVKVSESEEFRFDKGSLQNAGGQWINTAWKMIRVDRQERNPVIVNPFQGVPAQQQQQVIPSIPSPPATQGPVRKRTVLPTPGP